jgi:hypothetical protein
MRHTPPPFDREAAGRKYRFGDLSRTISRTSSARQERLGDRDRLPTETWRERVDERGLQWKRHASTIARFAVGAERAAMTQRRQAGQRQWENTIARTSTRIGDEPDAARVVLEGRIVEGRRWRSVRLTLTHRSLPSIVGSVVLSGDVP